MSDHDAIREALLPLLRGPAFQYPMTAAGAETAADVMAGAVIEALGALCDATIKEGPIRLSCVGRNDGHELHVANRPNGTARVWRGWASPLGAPSVPVEGKP